VHVRDVRVSPRDEVSFTRHDQELTRSSGKIRPGEPLQEALSRCGIVRRLLDLLARNRASDRYQAQREESGSATGQL
jgi:hypothetical protein